MPPKSKKPAATAAYPLQFPDGQSAVLDLPRYYTRNQTDELDANLEGHIILAKEGNLCALVHVARACLIEGEKVPVSERNEEWLVTAIKYFRIAHSFFPDSDSDLKSTCEVSIQKIKELIQTAHLGKKGKLAAADSVAMMQVNFILSELNKPNLDEVTINKYIKSMAQHIKEKPALVLEQATHLTTTQRNFLQTARRKDAAGKWKSRKPAEVKIFPLPDHVVWQPRPEATYSSAPLSPSEGKRPGQATASEYTEPNFPPATYEDSSQFTSPTMLSAAYSSGAEDQKYLPMERRKSAVLDIGQYETVAEGTAAGAKAPKTVVYESSPETATPAATLASAAATPAHYTAVIKSQPTATPAHYSAVINSQPAATPAHYSAVINSQPAASGTQAPEEPPFFAVPRAISAGGTASAAPKKGPATYENYKFTIPRSTVPHTAETQAPLGRSPAALVSQSLAAYEYSQLARVAPNSYENVVGDAPGTSSDENVVNPPGST